MLQIDLSMSATIDAAIKLVVFASASAARQPFALKLVAVSVW